MIYSFVSLEEASILEEIKYNTLLKKIIRCPKNYVTEQRPNPKGGKDLVFISISSLSKEAQKKHKQKTAIKKQVESSEIPWYVNAEYNWYMLKYPENYNQAIKIMSDIEDFNSNKLNMKSVEFQEYMAKKWNTSTRTIRRYMESYSEGSIWAYNKELETGENCICSISWGS